MDEDGETKRVTMAVLATKLDNQAALLQRMEESLNHFCSKATQNSQDIAVLKEREQSAAKDLQRLDGAIRTIQEKLANSGKSGDSDNPGIKANGQQLVAILKAVGDIIVKLVLIGAGIAVAADTVIKWIPSM